MLPNCSETPHNLSSVTIQVAQGRKLTLSLDTLKYGNPTRNELTDKYKYKVLIPKAFYDDSKSVQSKESAALNMWLVFLIKQTSNKSVILFQMASVSKHSVTMVIHYYMDDFTFRNMITLVILAVNLYGRLYLLN